MRREALSSDAACARSAPRAPHLCAPAPDETAPLFLLLHSGVIGLSTNVGLGGSSKARRLHPGSAAHQSRGRCHRGPGSGDGGAGAEDRRPHGPAERGPGRRRRGERRFGRGLRLENGAAAVHAHRACVPLRSV